MGFSIPTGSPQFVVNGQTYALCAQQVSGAVESFQIKVVTRQPDNSWNNFQTVVEYMNDGDCLADMQAKGGKVKYLQWLVVQINNLFTKLFGTSIPVVEPTTDQQAKDAISAYIPTLKIVVVNGVPVAS